MRTYSSKERSANFLLGADASAYMTFMEAVIPENGTLVIPPNAIYLSEQNILQYFLMPRSIISCGCDRTNSQDELSQSCIRCLQTPGYYVPAIGEFPPPDVLSTSKQFLAFDYHKDYFQGIYLPLNTAPFPLPAVDSQFEPLKALIVDLLILLAFSLVGAPLTMIILRRLDWFEVVIFSFPLGAGILAWFTFILSWAGVPISFTTVSLLFFALLGVGLVTLMGLLRRNVIQLRRPRLHIPTTFRQLDLPTTFAQFGILLLLTLIIILSIGRSYSLYDPIANWSLKGYAIADFGTIFAGENWGGHGLAYPMNLPLMISIFRIVDGDILPGSKLLFPIFTGVLLLGSFRFWQKRNVNTRIASLAILMLLSTPLVFQHATQGFSNLPFTAYIVLGILWCLIGVYDEDSRSLLMGGLMLALASWTRPEGFGFGIAIIVILLITRGVSAKGKLPLRPLLIPLAIVYGVWFAFASGFLTGDSVWTALPGFFDAVAEGRFNLSPILQILQFNMKQVFTPEVWGLAFPMAVVLSIIGLRRLRPRDDPIVLSLSLLSLSALTIPIGLFYVASFSRANFTRMLEINFDRALFPALFLCTVLAITSIAGRDEKNTLSDVEYPQNSNPTP